MGSDQIADEGGSVLVDPLIDRLMANAEPRMLPCESYSDQPWRPPGGNVGLHIAPDEVGRT